MVKTSDWLIHTWITSECGQKGQEHEGGEGQETSSKGSSGNVLSRRLEITLNVLRHCFKMVPTKFRMLPERLAPAMMPVTPENSTPNTVKKSTFPPGFSQS